MVKCAECGFLASRNLETRILEETEQITRDTGYVLDMYQPPICFVRVNDFRDDAIQKERICEQFTKWRQGSTPKEHQKMIDREARLKWQSEREDADKRWRDDQRRQDKKWRIVELIILVVSAGLFTWLGAFISRGWLP